ncbi:MAG: DUF885 domain-containing protein [Clostridium sp.]|nr:DUF885 domain-containing protein [Clostridium sp.]
MQLPFFFHRTALSPDSPQPKKNTCRAEYKAFIPLAFLLIGIAFALSSHFLSPADSSTGYRTGLLQKIENAQSFEDFTDALFCYETTTDSVTTAYTLKNPAACNIPTLEPRLTSFSYADYSKSSATEKNRSILELMSASLSRFPDTSLDEADRITCSLLQNNLSLSKAIADYPYYEDLLGSSNGVQANLPITLGEYPLRTETDIKTYLCLLKQVPDYFQDTISYEERRNELGLTTPDFLLLAAKDKMETMLKGFENGDNSFIDTFNERIAGIANMSYKKKKQYCEKNADYVAKYIVPSYQKLYEYIENRSSAASAAASDRTAAASVLDPSVSYGVCSLPDGASYYALLVQSSTGSSRTVPELISMTEQSLASALGDVLNIALTNQKTYFYYCENPMQSYYQTPEAILEALSLMIREDYPVLSDTPSYRVKTVSDSLASTLSPAFYMIPAIDDYQNNTIYINPLYTNEENGNLFTTLAHEGFPGHLYQTVYFNDTKPSRIRQVLNYPGYVEGWATYVEINSFEFLDYPLEGDALCRLYQAETIINLALSSRIDLGVNYEGWTLQDVRKFFEDNGFNSYYAENLYSYVVEAPANYLSYFIGYLEIMDLKQLYKNQEMENYTEKGFHQRLLDIGPSDFATLRKFMLVQR